MAPGLGRFGQDVSAYLLLIIAISTLGPLQFGFHLVRLMSPNLTTSALYLGLSWTS